MPSLPLRRRQMMTKGEHFRHPGRRLALCVAPYFADRGVGDMRGPPNGVPNMPPRRWWQAVIAPHNYVVHKMIHTAPRRKHSPAPPPGCDCVQERFGTPRMSPRPRVAKYGVSHGANHLRGWRNARLRSSSRCVGRCAASAEGHNVACLIVTTLHLRSCAGVGEEPPKTACQRYAPSPTIPPRHYTHRRIHDA